MNRRQFLDSGDESSSLDILLDGLTQKDLRLLMGKLIARHPDLANEISIQLQLLRTRPGATEIDETGPEPLDAGPILRAVRTRLHAARGYGAASAVASEVGHYLDDVTELLEASDGRNALMILEAVTEGVSGGFEIVDDSSGDLGSLYEDLGAAWTEAVLTAELTPDERTMWAKKLLKWQREVEDYGLDALFSVAIEAARQGWNDPSLVRAMRGESTPRSFGSHNPRRRPRSWLSPA